MKNIEKIKNKNKKKLFFGIYNPSIILTYVGVFFALCGICLLITESLVRLSMLCLIIAGICDMFDGRIAKKCKRTETEKEFGIQLDSLVDTISFVLFPVLLLFYMVGVKPLSLFIGFSYIFCGIMRLGWFNVTIKENGGYFTGIPVTFSAIIFPISFILLQFVQYPINIYLIQIIYFLTAILFISNIKFKKPGIIFSIVMVCIAILASVMLFML